MNALLISARSRFNLAKPQNPIVKSAVVLSHLGGARLSGDGDRDRSQGNGRPNLGQYRLFRFRKICREPSDIVAVVTVNQRRKKYCIEATWEGVLLVFVPRFGETET